MDVPLDQQYSAVVVMIRNNNSIVSIVIILVAVVLCSSPSVVIRYRKHRCESIITAQSGYSITVTPNDCDELIEVFKQAEEEGKFIECVRRVSSSSASSSLCVATL